MKHIYAPLLALTFTTQTLAEVPKVVTDIAPIHALAAQVMGDLGTPTLLVSASDTPHNFALRPSQAQALEQANLVVWVGEELTPWLEQPLSTLASNAQSLPLLDTPDTITLPFREGTLFGEDDDHHDDEEHGEEHHDDHGDEHHEEHGEDDHADEDHDEHDHDDHADEHHEEHAEGHEEEHHDDHDDHADEKHDDHGHDHEGADPHAWLDPRNGATWLAKIADALATQDPENADTYRANAAQGQAELAELERTIAAQLAPAQGRSFVVFHDAYHYFEDRFGLTTLGAISLSDAQPPSPKRLQTLRDALEGVDCVFTEPQFSPALVNTLLDGTNIGTAVLDPLGANLPTEASLYGAVLRQMADEIAGCAG